MDTQTLNRDRLEVFRNLPARTVAKRLFIVGASGSGKSTLRAALRSASKPQTLLFPVRFVSRHLRPDDSDKENQHLDGPSFEPSFQSGQLDFYWSKSWPEGIEYYGFQPCPAATIVYGCNDDFILNRPSLRSHTDLFAASLIVLVTCSADERTRRLAARYSDVSLPGNELSHRLMDTDAAVRDACDVVVDGETRDVAAAAYEVLRVSRLRSSDR